MFLIASCIHFIGVVFYALFASGELQPWAVEDVSLTFSLLLFSVPENVSTPQEPEKMEMASPGINANAYGKEAGYSEDYGKQQQETTMQPPAAADEYYDPSANGQQQQAQQQQGPMNPFTQQQYQKSATNPFAR